MLHHETTFQVPGAPGTAKLTSYIPERSAELPERTPRPTVIICPGGGYCGTSDREAEPVALRLATLGANAYVLRYHTAPQACYPMPQLELAWAIRHVRQKAAQEYGSAHGVFVLGFSAGGHLAASLGVLWHRADWAQRLGFHPEEIRPDGMMLAYPVVTSGPFAHQGSFDNLLGALRAELETFLSLEKQVTAEAVPAFIWHTFDDALVPVENSLLLVRALKDAHVPVELVIYPHGPHGLSLATEQTAPPDHPEYVCEDCQGWIESAARWARNILDKDM